jgi:elongation factor P
MDKSSLPRIGLESGLPSDPAARGQTAASSYKPAMLENGLRVLVPPFIGSGDRIVVDTSEGTYMRRAE